MNSSSTELSQLLTTSNCSLETHRYVASGRTPRKTPSSINPYYFRRILLNRCLTIDALLLRALAAAVICLPSRCLAMDTHTLLLLLLLLATAATMD
jgi:hypothetical protein